MNFTFSSGNTQHCVNIIVNDDAILEDTENFTASLSTSDPALTLAPGMAQVDILADPNDGERLTVHNANTVLRN